MRHVAAGDDQPKAPAHCVQIDPVHRSSLGSRLELDPFNRMLAVLETFAHLKLLATHGTLTQPLDGHAISYAADDAGP